MRIQPQRDSIRFNGLIHESAQSLMIDFVNVLMCVIDMTQSHSTVCDRLDEWLSESSLVALGLVSADPRTQ